MFSQLKGSMASLPYTDQLLNGPLRSLPAKCLPLCLGSINASEVESVLKVLPLNLRLYIASCLLFIAVVKLIYNSVGLSSL